MILNTGHFSRIVIVPWRQRRPALVSRNDGAAIFAVVFFANRERSSETSGYGMTFKCAIYARVYIGRGPLNPISDARIRDR